LQWRYETAIDQDHIAIDGFQRRDDPETAAALGDGLHQSLAIVAIASSNEDVQIFAICSIDLRPLLSSRRSHRRAMNALLDALDQVALPRQAMDLPNAQADQRRKAGQRGNDDCR
jgi:hypothetical protein